MATATKTRTPFPQPTPEVTEETPSFLDLFEQRYGPPSEAPPPTPKPAPVIAPVAPTPPPRTSMLGRITGAVGGLPSAIGQAISAPFTPEARRQRQAEGEAATSWEQGPALPPLPEPPPTEEVPPGLMGRALERIYTGQQEALKGQQAVIEQTPGLRELSRAYRDLFAGGFGTLTGVVQTPALIESLMGIETPVGRGAQQASEALRRVTQDLQPADASFVDQLIQGLGSTAPLILPGMGAANLATRVFGFSPRAAAWIGGTAAAIPETMVEGTQTYQDLMDRGLSPQDAAGTAKWVIAANAVLLPVSNKLGFFGESGKLARQLIMTALMEGGQEAAQTVIQKLAVDKGLKLEDATAIAQDFLVGATIGTLFKGTELGMQRLREGLPTPRTEPTAEPVPPTPERPALPPGPEAISMPPIPSRLALPETTMIPLPPSGIAGPVLGPAEQPARLRPEIPIEPTEPLVPGGPVPLPPLPPSTIRPMEAIPAVDETLMPGGPVAPPLPPAEGEPVPPSVAPIGPLPAPPPGEVEAPEVPVGTVRKNAARQGVELTFTTRPPEAVRQQLHAAGFKWNRARRLWYAPQTPENEALARRLAEEARRPELPVMPVEAVAAPPSEVSAEPTEPELTTPPVQVPPLSSAPPSVLAPPTPGTEGAAAPPSYQVGDRVSYTSSRTGQEFTGTIDMDWDDGTFQVQLDQAFEVGGSPGRRGLPIRGSQRVNADILRRIEPDISLTQTAPAPELPLGWIYAGEDLEGIPNVSNAGPSRWYRDHYRTWVAAGRPPETRPVIPPGLTGAEVQAITKFVEAESQQLSVPPAVATLPAPEPSPLPDVPLGTTIPMIPSTYEEAATFVERWRPQMDALIRQYDEDIAPIAPQLQALHEYAQRYLDELPDPRTPREEAIQQQLREQLTTTRIFLESEVLPELPRLRPRPLPPVEGEPPEATPPTAEALPPMPVMEAPTPEPAATASQQLANWVRGQLNMGGEISSRTLFAEADKYFGGTQAQGRYTPKDAYDAMELGVNQFIDENLRSEFANLQDASYGVDRLRRLLGHLPTQAKRTGEQESFQQFSTPPHLAYLAAHAANIQPGEVVLEPSAGIGGLAVFAKRAGAQTVVNELSQRRADILRQMGFDRVFTENAEQLNNILPPEIKPTVVLMNPPFSSSAGRLGDKVSNTLVLKHLEQALARLEPNGRLVAILGRGMADERSSMRPWWDKIKSQYFVRANIGLPGKEYAKYGTTFDNQLIVIDKIGPTPPGVTLTSRVESLEDALPLIEEVRNARIPSRLRPGERGTGEPAREAAPAIGGGIPRPQLPVPPTTLPVGPGIGGGPLAEGLVPVPPGEPERAPVMVTPERPELPAGTIEGGGAGAGERRPAAPGPVEPRADAAAAPVATTAAGEPNLVIEQQAVPEAATDISTSLYEPYQPQKLRIPGAKPHPGKLVQSAAMASVEPPDPTYTPRLPKGITDNLSIAQLEAVIYAGQAHTKVLPDEARKGMMIGDGTGVGKGREISGIILDNINQGRTKAVWVSTNGKLFNDAKRDFGDTGGDVARLFDLSKVNGSADIQTSQGVLFTTYSTLRNAARQTRDAQGNIIPGQKRLDQIVKWLGEDFDGVVAFDESHMMANALAQKGTRGMQAASAQALAGIDLQKKLPKARVVYVSATGATEVSNLAYAERLGLWGRGTPFANVQAFVTQIRAGGLAAMELVARDLKARGLYISRGLSFDDVTYETLEHVLTPEQREIYNTLVEAWQVVLQNVNEALQLTASNERGTAISGAAKSAAMSAFWGAHQRFFNQIITSMQMPSVLTRIRQDLDQGMAAVLQLVNTNEAMQERRLGEIEEELTPEALAQLDMTPRDNLMQYVQNSFPVAQYETYVDDNGNERFRQVMDSAGNPVLNADAIAMREQLLDELGSIRVPEGPLELLLNTFGPEAVAEVTGRSRRVVRIRDAEGERTEVQRRGESAALADARAFMDDRKRILVFSDAGGTGQSYHASLSSANQRKRQHYLVQPGWRADRAVQGMGRTHRTNEASAPNYILVTTDLKGQKRFLSSIARRLDQLGALTKGQRQTGGQGLFSERDNLESQYAQDAMRQFWIHLSRDNIPGLDFETVTKEMGLDLIDKKTGSLRTDLPTVTQFLNRILSLTIDTQNAVFDAFFERVEQQVANAIAAGTLDVGVETVKALKTDLVSEQTVYTDPESGAKTQYVHLQLTQPRKVTTWNEIEQARIQRGQNFVGYYLNEKSGRVSSVTHGADRTSESGEIVSSYISRSPTSLMVLDEEDLGRLKALDANEAKQLWTQTASSEPTTYTEEMHILTGAILPIWDRVIGKTRVVRLQSSDGRRFLGRYIAPKDLSATLQNLGATASAPRITPEEAVRKIIDEHYTLRLANGWSISQRRVSGEPRIEVTGPDYQDIQVLTREGAFTERINWQTRIFLPTGPEASQVMGAVLQYRPVVSVEPPIRSAADVLAAQRAVEVPTTAGEPLPQERITPAAREEPATQVAADEPLTGVPVSTLTSLDELERVNRPVFYVRNPQGIQQVRRGATAIQINDFEALDLFVHPTIGGKGWTVSDGITGFSVASATTRQKAINEAGATLHRVGMDKVQQVLLEKARKEGITPRYRVRSAEPTPEPPSEPPADLPNPPQNPQLPDPGPRDSGLSTLAGDEQGSIAITETIGRVMDTFTHLFNVTRPKLWTIQSQAADVYEAAVRHAVSVDHAEVVARGHFLAMQRIQGVTKRHLKDFARYWNSEMGKGIMADPERAPQVRVKILDPDEEQALLDDPVFQSMLTYYRENVQPLMEELAPSAGINTFLETPSGFYGKLHAIKAEDDPIDPVSVRSRNTEQMPANVVGYMGTGQLPRQLSRRRARAALRASGSGVYSEDLLDMLEHMHVDRFTAAYKNRLIEVVQRYKVPVDERTRRAPATIEFAGQEVPVVLSDVGTAKARAIARGLKGVPLEDIWLPKPVEEAWREVTVGSKLDTMRVPVLSQIGQGLTTAMLFSPADSFVHGMNVFMALTNAPGVGQSMGMFGRAMAWTPGKFLAVMADIVNIPGSEMDRVMPILAEYGGLRTSMYGHIGKAEELGQQVAGEVGRKVGHALSFFKRMTFDYPSYGRGLMGMEARSRVALYKAMEAKYPDMAPSERVMRMNNFLGTYVPALQPEIIKILRLFGLGNPFAVATATLMKTGVKGLAGIGPAGFTWETAMYNWISIPIALWLLSSLFDPEGDKRDPWEQPGWDPQMLRIYRTATETINVPVRFIFNSYARGIRATGIGAVAKAVAAGEKDPAELMRVWLLNGLNVGISLASGPFGHFLFGVGGGVAPYITPQGALLPLEKRTMQPTVLGRVWTGAKAAIPMAKDVGEGMIEPMMDPVQTSDQAAVKDRTLQWLQTLGQVTSIFGFRLKTGTSEREMASLPGRVHVARLAEIANEIAKEVRRAPVETRAELMRKLLQERVRPEDYPIAMRMITRSFRGQVRAIGRYQPPALPTPPPVPQVPKTGTGG